MSRIVSLILGVALLGVACADEADPSGQTPTSGSSSPSVVTSTTTAAPFTSVPTTVAPTSTEVTTTTVFEVPDALSSFDVGTIRLAQRELVVAIADTPALRSRGLMNVVELGSLDGMVFTWKVDSNGGFWMYDTLIPLDIAWFDAAGRYVSGLTMPPCSPDEACPSYEAAGPYRYALEMPEGEMPELGADSILELVEGF